MGLWRGEYFRQSGTEPWHGRNMVDRVAQAFGTEGAWQTE